MFEKDIDLSSEAVVSALNLMGQINLVSPGP